MTTAQCGKRVISDDSSAVKGGKLALTLKRAQDS